MNEYKEKGTLWFLFLIIFLAVIAVVFYIGSNLGWFGGGGS